MLYVLDTHTLIWFLANDPKLGKAASKLLDDGNNQFVLPAIVAADSDLHHHETPHIDHIRCTLAAH